MMRSDLITASANIDVLLLYMPEAVFLFREVAVRQPGLRQRCSRVANVANAAAGDCRFRDFGGLIAREVKRPAAKGRIETIGAGRQKVKPLARAVTGRELAIVDFHS